MFRPVETFRATLGSYASKKDTCLTLSCGTARGLDCVGIGNYTFLKLIRGLHVEIVRYTHTENYDQKRHPDTITVERNAVGCCDAHAFMCGDEVVFAWTAEGIRAVAKGDDDGQ